MNKNERPFSFQKQNVSDLVCFWIILRNKGGTSSISKIPSNSPSVRSPYAFPTPSALLPTTGATRIVPMASSPGISPRLQLLQTSLYSQLPLPPNVTLECKLHPTKNSPASLWITLQTSYLISQARKTPSELIMKLWILFPRFVICEQINKPRKAAYLCYLPVWACC